MIVYEETVNNLLDYIISNGFCLCYLRISLRWYRCSGRMVPSERYSQRDEDISKK